MMMIGVMSEMVVMSEKVVIGVMVGVMVVAVVVSVVIKEQEMVVMRVKKK
jgi:hypothetical protein